MLTKKQMTEEDIKLQFITPAIILALNSCGVIRQHPQAGQIDQQEHGQFLRSGMPVLPGNAASNPWVPRFLLPCEDTGQWVYDRIMVVECQNVIPPDKQDKQLLDKMYAEREGISMCKSLSSKRQ